MEEESGIDELMRLSQQFTRQEEEREEREKQREAKGKQVQGVLQGLRELKVSMAVEQLKSIATPEIIDEVNALKAKPGTEDLRKVMSNLADDLETQLSAISAKNTDVETLVNSMRTLNILMDLYFSLQ
jgi:predicted component of type VI protein secretion system